MPLSTGEIATVLPLWRDLEGATARQVNRSENQTFRIDTPARRSFSLRVHRDGYQTTTAIESELSWLAALRRDTALAIPEPIPGRDGRLLQSFTTASGTTRRAVLFHHIAGAEPTPETNPREVFRTLGVYAATMHQHAIDWQRPAAFERQVWQAATILDADGLWGDWRMAPGVTPAIRQVLDKLDATLWRRLAEYGASDDRYGLIHADMRLGNLLVDGSAITLIDFDDCGFCWFTYDFAAAISFHETNPAVPALRDAWLEGYRTVRQLSDEHVAAIDSMVMLRRMALLAWIGSHADTQLAQSHMEGFAEGTALLAGRYMRGPLWPLG